MQNLTVTHYSLNKRMSRLLLLLNDAGRSTYSVYQGFTTSKEEGLYGLGQLQNGQMMQRDITKHLVQGNVEDVSPFFQSTKGYGVFWDNYSGTTYTDNEQETSFRSRSRRLHRLLLYVWWFC